MSALLALVFSVCLIQPEFVGAQEASTTEPNGGSSAAVGSAAVTSSAAISAPPSSSALATANWWRAHVGRYPDGQAPAPLSWNTSLAASATNHTRYLEWVRSQSGTAHCTHGEVAGYPAASFGNRVHNVLFCGLDSMYDSINGWIQTPLHGNGFLNPDHSSFGAGSTGIFHAAGFDYAGAVTDGHYVFPAPGGTMPSAQWWGGEVPDPSDACPAVPGAPLAQPVNGEPVFFFHNDTGSRSYQLESWGLRRVGGSSVPSCFMDYTDSVTPGTEVDGSYGYIFPRVPFANGAQYEASISFRSVPSGGGTPGPVETMTWTFTVADYKVPSNLTATPVGWGTVEFTWDPAVVDAGYTFIEQSRDGGATWQWVDASNATAAGQLRLTDLSPGPIQFRIANQSSAQVQVGGPAAPPDFESAARTISGFYRPVVGDFDGDGVDDILWYAPGTSPDFLWLMRADGSYRSIPRTINGTYTALVGDFDGDGIDDILWYAPGVSPDFYWYSNSNGSYSSIPTRATGTYRPAVGDFDANGIDDILWYAPGTRADYFWYSRPDRQPAKSVRTTSNGTYTPFVGDFDGNGLDDVFWNGGWADSFLWYAQPNESWSSTAIARTYSNTPVTGDFNNDGRTDILWYAPGPGADSYWMFGPSRTYAKLASSVNGFYTPVSGDFNGDGRGDILWYAPGGSADFLWVNRTP